METGKRNSFFATSMMPSNFAPPPQRTAPAGKSPSRPIFFNSPFTFEKISSTRASIISAKALREIASSSDNSSSVKFISSFLEIFLELAEPYFNFNRSATSSDVLKQRLISRVMWSEPMGSTATCIKSPSSNTAKLVIAAPMFTTATPTSFCRGLKTTSALAKILKTKSSIFNPVRCTHLVKFFICTDGT